jgi:hypothetical protein
MGDKMKRVIISFLCLLLVLSVACKKRDAGRVRGDAYTIEEALDSLPLVTVSDKELAVIDLKSNEVITTYPLRSADVLRTFLFKNALFVVCKNEVSRIDIKEEKTSKVKLSFDAKGACGLSNSIMLWGDKGLHLFNKNGKVEEIAQFDGMPVELQPFPDFTSIAAVLQKDGKYTIARFSLLSGEMEKEERIEDFVKMRISPFGKRIYILMKQKLVFLDAKNLRFISEIPFKGEGVDFIVTASENRVFVFTREPAKIISIKRTMLKVEEETELSFPPNLTVMSGDGGNIFFLALDSLFRFDTGSNAIVKSTGKKANEFDYLLTTPKGLRVAMGKRGGAVVELLNGNTLLLEKEVPVEGELLYAICGTEAFGKKEAGPPPDTLMPDSIAPESLPLPQKDDYFTLQVSSSSILEGARKLMNELKMKSLPAFIDSSEKKEGAPVYRVRVGAFESRKDAEQFSRGLEAAYGIDSWLSSQEIAPFYLSEAGIDINGDKNGEMLLYEGNTIYLFTGFGGVQKRAFTKSFEGINFTGAPRELHEDNVVLLAVPFKPDSLIAVRWFDNKFEVVKRKAPQE